MRPSIVRHRAPLVLGILLVSSAAGQNRPDTARGELSWDFAVHEPDASVGDLVEGLLTPQAVLDARRIRAYVRDPRFEQMRLLEGDIRAADAIYLRALEIGQYDIARALLLALLATLEHRNLPLRMPLAGIVSLPLTFEGEDNFRARVLNLPRMVYPDSPAGGNGDRDKLQHFFGSASVAYSTESSDMAQTTGDLVEWGESSIVEGGVDDPRDRRANAQGGMFGHDLVYLKTMLPSDYLRLPFP